MFRFYDPVEGSVLLNGQDVSMLKQKSSRGAIGVVPQVKDFIYFCFVTALGRVSICLRLLGFWAMEIATSVWVVIIFPSVCNA